MASRVKGQRKLRRAHTPRPDPAQAAIEADAFRLAGWTLVCTIAVSLAAPFAYARGAAACARGAAWAAAWALSASAHAALAAAARRATRTQNHAHPPAQNWS